MAVATLTAIRNKIRKLTRTPSTNQLSTNDINEYINTFIAYDMPAQLRLFSLETSFNGAVSAYKGDYDVFSDLSVLGTALGDVMTTLVPPVYVDGHQLYYTQSPEDFLNIYPSLSTEVTIATGDGATVGYAGTLTNGQVLPKTVLITALDANNNSINVTDSPNADQITGELATGITAVGTINYVTGAYSLTFGSTPASGAAITASYHYYQTGRPQAVLYYDNILTFRPIPDKAYRLFFGYFKQPTQLLVDGSEPDIEQWWQYIAYGAAIKVFQDRMEMESIQMIMPEFRRQENMVLRRTLVQQSTQRSATIYSDQSGLQGGFDNFYNGYY